MAPDPKSVVRSFFDGINANDASVIEELVADDFVERETFPGIPPDKEGVRHSSRCSARRSPTFAWSLT